MLSARLCRVAAMLEPWQPLNLAGGGRPPGRRKDMFSWLIDALREPAAQLVNLLGLALVAAATARVRGKQKRAHEQLRESGALPPKPSE